MHLNLLMVDFEQKTVSNISHIAGLQVNHSANRIILFLCPCIPSASLEHEIKKQAQLI